jgi:hypothetical protein
MLCAVMNDLGQTVVAALPLAQTTRSGVSSARAIQPHRRLVSRPAFRHPAHSQPAWFEN